MSAWARHHQLPATSGPFRFTVSRLVDGSHRVTTRSESEAKAIAVEWSTTGARIVTITASGAESSTYALKHLVWVEGSLVETGWSTYISGRFVGERDGLSR